MSDSLDNLAVLLFTAAIKEDRCGELLECLFNGGSATIDFYTKKLSMISGETLSSFWEKDE